VHDLQCLSFSYSVNSDREYMLLVFHCYGTIQSTDHSVCQTVLYQTVNQFKKGYQHYLNIVFVFYFNKKLMVK